MVEAVELGDARGGGGVVLTELFCTLAFFVAAFEEVIPLIKMLQGLFGDDLAHKRTSFDGWQAGDFWRTSVTANVHQIAPRCNPTRGAASGWAVSVDSSPLRPLT